MSTDSLSADVLDEAYGGIAADFASASSAAELALLVEKIDSQSESVDLALQRLVHTNAKKHTNELADAELGRAKLLGAIATSAKLKDIFTSANDLGQSLTLKIKALDQEIGNVDSTLRFVENVQTLKHNVLEAHYAIDKGDWDLAARCILTIKHKLDQKLVSGQYASVVVPSSEVPQLPLEAIEEWTLLLSDKFQKSFYEAAEQKNIPEITKFFQLFPLICKEEVGLTCYSKFICKIISDTSKTLVQSVDGKDAPGLYSSVVVNFFQSITLMLSQHTPIIEKNYSGYPKAIQFVVTKIQREIDSQLGLIADSFYDANRVDKLLQDVKLHTFAYLEEKLTSQEQMAPDEDIVSVVEIGDLVHEFASIMHQWMQHCRFVAVKYYPQEGKGVEWPQLLLDLAFQKKIKVKLLPAFESLYLFYFRRSFEKALAIEELPDLDTFLHVTKSSAAPEQPPVSSVIEDFTLVFNNTVRNVIECGQPVTFKKFIAECSRVIHHDLLGFLQNALEENAPRYNATLSLLGTEKATPVVSRTGTPAPESVSSSFFKGASSALNNVVGSANTAPVTAKLVNFVIYINTVAAGQEFLGHIVSNVTTKNPTYLESNYPFGSDERVGSLFKTELLEPFVERTGKLMKENVRVFFDQSMKNKVSALVNECFPDLESAYVVYSSALLGDPTTSLKFKQTWDSLICPYRQTLHPAVYERLLLLLSSNIASMIEKKLVTTLKRTRINEFGALKLDKDVLFIIGGVCEDDYKIRDRFVRLTQMVLLLGMDSEEYDFSSHNSDNGINWVLTPLERKQIRRLRM